MVCKNKNLMLATFQMVTLCFENFDNSQKLIVMDLVLYFHWNYFLQKEGYWMPLTHIGFSDYLIRTSFGS